MLKEWRDTVDKQLASLRVTQTQLQEEEEKHTQLMKRQSANEEALQIAQDLAQTIQQQAHNQIAQVVGLCLQTVFDGDDSYDFKIRFDKKRNKTEAKLILLKNGHEIENILEDDSGGVIDVAAFALRLSCLVLTKPILRKLIILDEPFKFVSEEFRPNIKEMLMTLSKKFGIQFLLVTHIKELEAGKIISL
jgi:DNA repair exonuclease SbcCD ATPase subunit